MLGGNLGSLLYGDVSMMLFGVGVGFCPPCQKIAVGFCAVGFCPVGFCPSGFFFPLGFCPFPLSLSLLC